MIEPVVCEEIEFARFKAAREDRQLRLGLAQHERRTIKPNHAAARKAIEYCAAQRTRPATEIDHEKFFVWIRRDEGRYDRVLLSSVRKDDVGELHELARVLLTPLILRCGLGHGDQPFCLSVMTILILRKWSSHLISGT